MSLLWAALKPLLRPLLASLLRGAARCSRERAGIALLYHRVGDPEGNPERELVPALGSDRFEAQVRHLRDHYRLVSASELPMAAAARRRGQRFPVAVTFDDDSPSHARVAKPILERVGATATFFLSGASLREPFAFWWERLQRTVDRGLADRSLLHTIGAGAADVDLSRPAAIHEIGQAVEDLSPPGRAAVAAELGFRVGPDPPDAGMRAAEVEALATSGFEIGFHTRRHDPLPSLEDDALARALEWGRSELAAVAGRELTAISYPHGKFDARVAAAARRAGYRVGFTTEPELARPSADPLLIGRFGANSTSLDEFGLAIARAIKARR